MYCSICGDRIEPSRVPGRLEMNVHRRAGLACLGLGIGCISACAWGQTEWWFRSNVFRTKYYHVKTDLPRDQALELAHHMDMTFDAYAEMFAGLRVRRPAKLDMYLFATEQDYLQTLRARFGNDGRNSWGKCITRGKLISLVAWKGRHGVEAVKALLQHEGFHQFSSHLFPKLPTWADEGLAEVFERGVAFDDRIVLGEVSENDKRRLANAIEGKRFRPLRQVFTIEQSQWNEEVRQGNAQVNYVQAWSLVHFFLYGEDGRHQRKFIKFLVGLNQGVGWKRAFVAAFGNPNVSAVEQAWMDYVAQLPPMDYEETIRRMEFLAVGVSELRQHTQYPVSLGELKQGLRQINFEYTSKLFGESRALSASDEQLFQVPFASITQTNPTFQLVESSGRNPQRRAAGKRKARRPPPPPDIVTDGLEPRNFAVRWKRVRGKSDYTPWFVAE